jgi:YegS/Rv2252/BmrU family lipid kinase
MTRSACLIFNPVAGQGDPQQQLDVIRSILESELELDVCLTSEEITPEQLAKAAIDRGVEMVIASGGDGTISQAAGALIGTKTPLGIISTGTANAFANALNLPTNLEEACRAILNGETRTLDVAYCNQKPMLLLAGIGFEAETVELADRESKNNLGIFAYVVSGLKQLRNLKHFDATIETDDKEIKVSAAAITVANVAPPTSVLAQGPAGIIADDGLLDVTIISPRNLVGAIAAAYSLLHTALQGNPAERDDIGYLRSKRVVIATDPPQKIVLDGEIIGKTPIEVECVPQGLIIFAPTTREQPPDEKLENLPNLEVKVKDKDAP